MNGIAPFQPKRRRLELSGRKEAQNRRRREANRQYSFRASCFLREVCEVVC